MGFRGDGGAGGGLLPGSSPLSVFWPPPEALLARLPFDTVLEMADGAREPATNPGPPPTPPNTLLELEAVLPARFLAEDAVKLERGRSASGTASS